MTDYIDIEDQEKPPAIRRLKLRHDPTEVSSFFKTALIGSLKPIVLFFFLFPINTYAINIIVPISFTRTVNYLDVETNTVITVDRTPEELTLEAIKCVFILVPVISTYLVSWYIMVWLEAMFNQGKENLRKMVLEWRTYVKNIVEEHDTGKTIFELVKPDCIAGRAFSITPYGYCMHVHPMDNMVSITKLNLLDYCAVMRTQYPAFVYNPSGYFSQSYSAPGDKPTVRSKKSIAAKKPNDTSSTSSSSSSSSSSDEEESDKKEETKKLKCYRAKRGLACACGECTSK